MCARFETAITVFLLSILAGTVTLENDFRILYTRILPAIQGAGN